VTAVTNTRVLHLWSTRSSASRPLDRTTARSTDDDDARRRRRTTTTNAGNPTRPSLPRFALHARPSTRRRRRDPGLLNDDDEASERSLENGTERAFLNDSSSFERDALAPAPAYRTADPKNRTEQNRTDRSRCRSRPIVPTRTDERTNGWMSEIKLNFKGGAESSFSRAFFLMPSTLFIHTLPVAMTHVFNPIKTVCTHTTWHDRRRSEQSVKTWMRRDTRFMCVYTVYTYVVWHGMARQRRVEARVD